MLIFFFAFHAQIHSKKQNHKMRAQLKYHTLNGTKPTSFTLISSLIFGRYIDSSSFKEYLSHQKGFGERNEIKIIV